jgi:endonuclease III
MPIRWTDNPAADELLEKDPLALLIGLVLDQQVKMEKAFSGPYELKQRLGHLDAGRIAAMDPDRLMAKRVQQLCAGIDRDYGGDAGRVWKDAGTGQELAARLKKLPGFGDMKVKITVAVLAKKFGVKPPGWEAYGANWHTVADVDSAESMAEARVVKRQMKAEQHPR